MDTLYSCKLKCPTEAKRMEAQESESFFSFLPLRLVDASFNLPRCVRVSPVSLALKGRE